MKLISLRASDEMLREIEKLAKVEYTDKSTILRESLERGLAEKRLEIAMKFFAEGKFSTGEAAEFAGISAGEFMDAAVKRGLRSEISAEDLKGN